MDSHVDVGILVLTQGRECTMMGGHLEESVTVGRLPFTVNIPHLIWGRAICDLVCYLIIYFAPSTIYLPSSLKWVSLFLIHIPRDQWDFAFK